MKVRETLAVATILAGSLSACDAQQEVGCGPYIDKAAEVSVNSIAKAMRLCYDHTPEGIRRTSGNGTVNLSITTKRGGVVYFSAFSEAPPGSSPDEYAQQASFVFSSVFPPGSTEIETYLAATGTPYELSAEWEGPIKPRGDKVKVIAGISPQADLSPAPTVWTEPKDAITIPDPTNPKLVECTRHLILSEIATALGTISSQSDNPAYSPPLPSSACTQA